MKNLDILMAIWRYSFEFVSLQWVQYLKKMQNKSQIQYVCNFITKECSL